MKRRNADTGKLRRPIKRTKITEGMYGNSMMYLKFALVWASVVLADYLLEFRFEFLWPFWMMFRTVYDTYKYQGLAFSVFFICIALTSDMICFFFIPIQYIFFAASTYVWVQYVWYTFADKGICVPTVAICCVVVYVEGARGWGGWGGWGGAGGWAWGGRGLAAHCVGFPAVALGVGVKAYVGRRLRARTMRQVRAHNDFYFQLMRDALPQSAMGEVRERRCKPQQNGHATREHAELHAKLEQLEQVLEKKQREREKEKNNHVSSSNGNVGSVPSNGHGNHVGNGVVNHSNGVVSGPGATDDDEKHNHCKVGSKTSKYDKKEANSTIREEKKRNKHKDSSDSHKSTEQNKEQIRDKEVESTKEYVKVKEVSSNSKEREKDKEKEREDEKRKEKESKEKEREREQERERELRINAEELKRLKAELASAKSSLNGAKSELATLRADLAERQRRDSQRHHTHNKTCNWSRERAALERRLAEERRARTAAEQMLKNKPDSGCCGGGGGGGAEGAALQAELGAAARRERALAERTQALQRALSAETRVKLDLLAALGDANRRMHIQDGIINRQEKELEELKAQMLAVMPAELVDVMSGGASKLRLDTQLDPNASVYTPKQQLCSDA